MSKEDERSDISVEEYIDSIGDKAVEDDARIIFEMMREISDQEAVLYGIGTIGFGVYKYEYESGRKGEAHTLAFYPRKGKITIYLMDGTERYAKLLSKLGKHSTTGYCIYIKTLADIELPVLKELLMESYRNITSKSMAGGIDKILWKSE